MQRIWKEIQCKEGRLEGKQAYEVSRTETEVKQQNGRKEEETVSEHRTENS